MIFAMFIFSCNKRANIYFYKKIKLKKKLKISIDCSRIFLKQDFNQKQAGKKRFLKF
jgi:hypothetical protein